MEENVGELPDTSKVDAVQGQNGGDVAETEVESVAPWQQAHEEEDAAVVGGVMEEQIDHSEGPSYASEQPYDLEAGVAGQDGDVHMQDGGEDDNPLAGLGSVDDIAAAAMQAAGLSALFGEIGADEGEAPHGTKRSHDEMTKEQEEAAVMEAFSTVAPEPSDSPTKPIDEQALPSSTNVASFQNSFAQFQAEPSSALPSVPALQTTEAIAPPADVGDVNKSSQSSEMVADDKTNAAMPEGANELDVDTTAVTGLTEEGPVEEGGELNGLPLIGFQDLQAVAQAAMGLDADGNPLPGNEESHRALAEAVKRLSAAQGITLPHESSNGYYEEEDGNPRDDTRGSQDGGPVKRFQCSKCERAFARAYNLNTHLATHDPDPARSKPFPCPYPSCKTDGGRSFSRKHDLQRHVASTHENEPEPGIDANDERGLASLGLGTPGRKFRCDECGRAFVRRDALKRHQCTKVMETTSEPPRRVDAPDYFLNPVAGLSLYTSNSSTATSKPSLLSHQNGGGGGSSIPSASASAAGSSYDSDPFGPNGITYENLSKEVQDMAMQLVAQAQSYNDQKGKSTQSDPTPSTADPLPVQEVRPPKIPASLQSTQPTIETQSSVPLPREPMTANKTPLPTPSLPAQPLQAFQALKALDSTPGPSLPPSSQASSLLSSTASTSAPLPAPPPPPPPTPQQGQFSGSLEETEPVKVKVEEEDQDLGASIAVDASTVEINDTPPTATTPAPAPAQKEGIVKAEDEPPTPSSPPYHPSTSNASTTTPSLVSAQ
ncbi:hypothetical protein CBS101457_003140 [Exobasidium rhododendri]|nr:hypothetical protein CBS101457_003140 [Exobasidium rhododendri]